MISLGKPDECIIAFLKRKIPSNYTKAILTSGDKTFLEKELGTDLNVKQQILEKGSEETDTTLLKIESNDSSISCISDNSMYDCEALTDISAKYVKKIGEQAFAMCYGLSNVQLPNVEFASVNAFVSCGLQTVDLPNLKDSEECMFQLCKNLVSCSLPSLIKLQDMSFIRCDNLKYVYLPNNTEIGCSAFYECSSLTSVYSPNVNSIYDAAFCGCSNLSSIDFPNVTLIKGFAFAECSNLISVNCPNVSSIGSYTFYGCLNLSSINCSTVNSIEDYAFQFCSNLSSIYLPNVNSIGARTFNKCSKLLCVDFGNTLTSVPAVQEYSFDKLSKKISCYVPDSLYDSWTAQTNWAELIALNKVQIIKQSDK